jgi:hypoxanthine phosphoribosyltransferase
LRDRFHSTPLQFAGGRPLRDNQLMDSPKLRTLISSADIRKRVGEIGREIKADYPDQLDEPPLHLIAVLKGAYVFAADLARAVQRDVSIDFIGVSSYGAETETSGQVRITKDLDEDIAGRDVLLVEDVVDTGLTLQYLLGVLQKRKPRSLRVATFLDKPSKRTAEVELDYVGFEIPDEFVVGYGLDLDQRFRNLPDVRATGPEPEPED